jgi:hypothetical protein
MLTIWKFDAPITDEFSIEMPAGATVLTVQMQAGEPKLWALVNPTNHRKQYQFRWFGTGHHLEPSMAYAAFIGTVQITLTGGGTLVFHLFDVSNDK